MPFFSVRCSTSTQSCSRAPARRRCSPVPSGEPSSTTSTRKPSGAALREHLAGGVDDRLDVLGLVVGRQYQPGLAGHRRRRTLDQSCRRPERAPTPRSPTRWRSSATCTSSTARSCIACSPTARAAKAVREASVSVAALAREGRATELPGIGKTLQEKILALLETGTIPAAEKLRAKFPPGLIAITRLPGLGPKRARLLHSELGIDSPQALREAALRAAPAHRARARPEVRGERAERLEQLDASRPSATGAAHRCCRARSRSARRSSPACAQLAGDGGHERARRLGAPARGQVKDIDLIATTTRPDAARQEPAPSSSRSSSVSSAGEAGAQGAHALRHRRRPADRRARRSSATCCSTSPARARTTRRCARRRCAAGCTSPSTASSTTPPARTDTCASEEEVYARLGLAYIEPELRENRGELEAARDAAALPRADRARGHPRRPALPHDRLRRPRHDRGDGARRARARLRVPRDHRPLGEPRLRQRRLRRAAAPPDRARARGQRARRGDRAARRQRGQHPARRLARLRRRAAGASSTG